MRILTTILSLFCSLLFFTPASAQEVKFPALDKSPMDAAHYPFRSRYLNYIGEDDPNRERKIKVLYSRPQRNDREIFGALIPYGTDWRLGANEATEVTFYRDVDIDGSFLRRGTYTMFAQVYPDYWIIKFSRERFIGGSQDRDMAQDLVTVSVPTKTIATPREAFTIGYQRVDDDHVDMLFEWDRTRVSLPISFNAIVLEEVDPSPMDLIQYPPMSRLRNFLEEDQLAENEPQIRVVYSRPQLKGRAAFGAPLVPYGELWRLGANETTQLTFFNDVTIAGQSVEAGNYGLFAEPRDGEWVFVLHKGIQTWGSLNYNEEDEILRTTVTTQATPATLEAVSMVLIEKEAGTVELVVGWENTMARLPILLK